MLRSLNAQWSKLIIDVWFRCCSLSWQEIQVPRWDTCVTTSLQSKCIASAVTVDVAFSLLFLLCHQPTLIWCVYHVCSQEGRALARPARCPTRCPPHQTQLLSRGQHQRSCLPGSSSALNIEARFLLLQRYTLRPPCVHLSTDQPLPSSPLPYSASCCCPSTGLPACGSEVSYALDLLLFQQQTYQLVLSAASTNLQVCVRESDSTRNLKT